MNGPAQPTARAADGIDAARRIGARSATTFLRQRKRL